MAVVFKGLSCAGVECGAVFWLVGKFGAWKQARFTDVQYLASLQVQLLSLPRIASS